MNVTFPCPKCDQAGRVNIEPSNKSYNCPNCQQTIAIPNDAFANGKLRRCLACPSTDLFVRKDFPQQLGVGIVVVGFLASCIPWAYSYPLWTYAILFATALIDLSLYLFVPECLMCYRCGAQYRSAPGMHEHGKFDLETHERHRQHKIRLAEMQYGQQNQMNNNSSNTPADQNAANS